MRKMRGVVALCLHGDLFAPGVKDEWIGQILNEIFFNPLATWLVLTKQPKRMADCVRRWYGPGLAGYGRPTPGTPQERMPQFWPGVSVSGDQDALRIDELLATPAAHHWLSYEPATEPLRLFQEHLVHQSYGNDILDAVIVGAESGPGRRPMQPEWAARIGDQCRQAGVPFFLKQGVRDGKVVSYPPPTNWPWIRKE
jgi:protein gp37